MSRSEWKSPLTHCTFLWSSWNPSPEWVCIVSFWLGSSPHQTPQQNQHIWVFKHILLEKSSSRDRALRHRQGKQRTVATPVISGTSLFCVWRNLWIQNNFFFIFFLEICYGHKCFGRNGCNKWPSAKRLTDDPCWKMCFYNVKVFYTHKP